MRIERQLAFWLGALAIAVLLLWLLSGVLMPFVAGMALAYLLNPVANRLQRMGVNRLVACIVILGVAVILFVILLVAVIPLLVAQLSHFADNLPGYITRLQELARTLAAEQGDTLSKWLGFDIFQKFGAGDGKPADVAGPLGNLVSRGMSWLSGLIGSLISGGSTLIGVASLLVITPVVAFYMLVDWERMIRTLDGLVPVDHRDTVRRLAHEIDTAIGGFLRGQSLVCLFLGVWYGFGLLLVGLNFGFVIGLTGGFLSFIPYVGSLTVLVISAILAIVQGWPSLWLLAMVLVVVGTGQFLEGNVLTPRLVGASVGVHPVWLMFALLAFGSLMGFTGLLVAVPLAAAIGVLIRFGIERYRQSALYRGAQP